MKRLNTEDTETYFDCDGERLRKKSGRRIAAPQEYFGSESIRPFGLGDGGMWVCPDRPRPGPRDLLRGRFAALDGLRSGEEAEARVLRFLGLPSRSWA